MSAEMAKAIVKKMSNAEVIRSATSAAPSDIGSHATLVAPDASGKLAPIRTGTNDWTCLANEPSTPGVDPMCSTRRACCGCSR